MRDTQEIKKKYAAPKRIPFVQPKAPKFVIPHGELHGALGTGNDVNNGDELVRFFYCDFQRIVWNIWIWFDQKQNRTAWLKKEGELSAFCSTTTFNAISTPKKSKKLDAQLSVCFATRLPNMTVWRNPSSVTNSPPTRLSNVWRWTSAGSLKTPALQDD